eukprot:523625-Pelagomonas_calceolata.AAC.3
MLAQKNCKSPPPCHLVHVVYKATEVEVLMGIWRVTGSTRLQSLAVRNYSMFHQHPGDCAHAAGLHSVDGAVLHGKLCLSSCVCCITRARGVSRRKKKKKKMKKKKKKKKKKKWLWHGRVDQDSTMTVGLLGGESEL